MTDHDASLSHLDERGHARMVDVSGKAATAREATARGRVVMQPETLAMIVEGRAPKGDVLATARIAGIMAAKRTHELIPLCHPLPISTWRPPPAATRSRSRRRCGSPARPGSRWRR